MVLEDYGELMFLQTVLKKLGFDVDAIQNPRSLGDAVLRMNPDILVLTALGKRIKGVELSRGIRKVRGAPKIILLRSGGTPPGASAESAVDGWLDTPVAIVQFLEMISDLGTINKQSLLEKLQKLQLKEIEARTRILKLEAVEENSLEVAPETSGNFGVLQSSTMPSAERLDRYAKYLTEPLPGELALSTKAVADNVKALRAQENSTDLEDLERERKAFVEHLFRKKD